MPSSIGPDSCRASSPRPTQHASGSSSNAQAQGTSQVQQRSRHDPRQRLQRQCLQPSGLARTADFESRAAAWRYLLDITPEHVRPRKAASSDVNAIDGEQRPSPASSIPSIVDESLNSTVPLDKDGWQVASDDILNQTTPKSPFAGNGSSNAQQKAQTKPPDADWKVVESKKTKRRKGGQSTPSLSSAASPELAQSPRWSETTPTDTSAPSSPLASSKLDVKSSTATSSTETSPPGSVPIPPRPFPNLAERDVEQVAKDVERSFIGPAFKNFFSPDSNGQDERSLRRQQLTHLVLTTLSHHTSLSYFQGYHDILSVVLLTLASTSPRASASGLFANDEQEALIELVAGRISLHLIRDSMTRDLLPVMGQLKILGNLLRLSDAPLAELAERASPLPFFALPWLLTLLTHDASNVAVMQRVLEFVIAHGPASAIYVCAAVLSARRQEILAMGADELEDPAMLHAILSRFPRIWADGEEQHVAKPTRSGDTEETAGMYTDPDVELPSLAPDRALAASRSESAVQEESGMPVSELLQEAVRLMRRFEFDSADVGAHTIMGSASVLFTWPSAFVRSEPADDLEWSRLDAAAHAALSGPTDAVVLDPHPPVPPAPPGEEEKPVSVPAAHANAHHARTLALVGISGILVAALWTASQTTPNSALATEETKRVLTLIVSLLSNFGRVIES